MSTWGKPKPSNFPKTGWDHSDTVTNIKVGIKS